MRGRCEVHGLAFGPKGCLACAREGAGASGGRAGKASAAQGAAEAQPAGMTTGPVSAADVGSLPARQVNIAVPPALLVVPLAALALYGAWSWHAGRAVKPAATSASLTVSSEPALEAESNAEPAAEAAGVERATASDVDGAPPERGGDVAGARVRGGEVERESPRAGAAPEPSTGGKQAGSATEGEAASAAAPPGRAPQWSPAELEAARDRVEVTVYYTEWCPACRAARGYFSERGIRTTEHDVEKDARANARKRLLNPEGGVPTIEIDGRVLVGFSAKRIEQTITHAAMARLARY